MAPIELSKYRTITRKTHFEDRPQRSIVDYLNIELTLFEKKFGSKEKEAFYSELSLLLSTGVDIRKAFEIIEEDIINKKHKQLIITIKENIIKGLSIYEAIDMYPNVFSKYESQSIKIGEESGKLPEVLKELGLYYKSAIRLKRQIIGVLTYPLVVIVLAILIVYFMLAYVVPIFSDVFTQTGNELPGITKFLISISHKSHFILYAFLSVSIVGFIVHKTQHKKEWFRKSTSQILLKIPVINKLILKIYLSRFCQSMKLLVGARVMINEALELVKNMIDYYPIEKALEGVQKDVVEQGRLLNESLSQYTIFPKKLIALIKLSEEVNEPELIFDKLNQQYSAEIEHQQAVLGKLIEPIFIIVLGLFVGFILVAMYLPMFEMSTGSF